MISDCSDGAFKLPTETPHKLPRHKRGIFLFGPKNWMDVASITRPVGAFWNIDR